MNIASQRTAPVFVVGAPRSGTTMLRLALNSHPAFASPGETYFFPHVYEPFLGRGFPDWHRAIDAHLQRCERIFAPPCDLSEVRTRLRSLPEPDPALLLSLPMTRWAKAQGKRRWAEKTPIHIFHADRVVQLFPAARVIAIRRDPRSVVASMNRFAALSDDTATNARLWRDVWTVGRATLERGVPAAQRLEVEYERIIADPESGLRAICEFLEEDFSPAMLTARPRQPGIEPRPLTALTRPIAGDPVGWREQLSPRDIAIIETICGAKMDSLGYPREGIKLSPRDRAAVTAKMAYVTLKQRQNRHQRYHKVAYRPLERLRRSPRR